MQKSFKMGELFCGPGGIALGAKLASEATPKHSWKIEHAWATDYDRDTCKTYISNICPNAPHTVVCEDIRDLDMGVLREISEIDGLAFGFPCNDFSIVGEQKGINGNYGPLYQYGIEALNLFRPQWFLAENVGGLRNSNEGNALALIFEEMVSAGYVLYPHYYKFERYGIPQARHRIVIVGIRSDLDVVFQVPSPEPYFNCDVSCRKAICDPPIAKNAPNHTFTKQSKTVVERLKYIKPGENAFTANIPEHLRLNVKGAKISVIYKRLDPLFPAYTVTGSGGGGTHMYHWSENRALTNRERARLQTFPDNFVFHGSKESVRKQIGMAVPCQGAKVIFEGLLLSFSGIKYSSVDCSFRKQVTSSSLVSAYKGSRRGNDC